VSNCMSLVTVRTHSGTFVARAVVYATLCPWPQRRCARVRGHKLLGTGLIWACCRSSSQLPRKSDVQYLVRLPPHAIYLADWLWRTERRALIKRIHECGSEAFRRLHLDPSPNGNYLGTTCYMTWIGASAPADRQRCYLWIRLIKARRSVRHSQSARYRMGCSRTRYWTSLFWGSWLLASTAGRSGRAQ